MDRLTRVIGHFRTSEEGKSGSNVAPMKVLVTGACGNIAGFLLFLICKGNMLGATQKIDLVLLDIPQMADSLKGVEMELNDGAFPLVNSIVVTTDYKIAFSGIDIACLVGARPRGKGMTRADLLQANASIFEGQGKALNAYAKRSVKVIVVGNPANTNALITSKFAPNIPKSQITAMTRLDQSRALSQISDRLRVPVASVKNMFVWGNHSASQYPDASLAYVADFPQQGMNTSVKSMVNDDEWLRGAFIKTVATRGGAIIKARGKSSAASAANACVDHMRSWVLGTAPGEIVSMGVSSDGNSYGVPEGLVFSFPCTCKDGKWTIVDNIPISHFSQGKIDTTAKELQTEKEAALSGN
jgi:malate dehydrogenase